MTTTSEYHSMKTCGRCGELKLLTMFHRQRSRKDGRDTWCKLCKRDYNREYMRKRRRREELRAPLRKPQFVRLPLPQPEQPETAVYRGQEYRVIFAGGLWAADVVADVVKAVTS